MAQKKLTAASPASQGVTWETYENRLLVIEPLELEKGMTTVHSKTPGDTDAVRANVHVLVDKAGNWESFEDTLIFPKVLVSQLRRQIGSIVAGRLTKGEKKAGKNAPWTLAEPNQADMKKAADFLSNLTLSAAGDDSDDSDDSDDPWAPTDAEEDAF